MASSEPPRPSWNWKRLALKWLAFGIGVALGAAAIIGSLVWYTSRPTPPKPWDTRALVAGHPPGFSVTDDGKRIRFSYPVENRTEEDYKVELAGEVKILVKTEDGGFSQPLPDEAKHLEVPIFIPAKQTGTIVVFLSVSGIPTKEPNEADKEYHERIRTFCNDRLKGVYGLALFDETNRYRIDLPRWLPERPKNEP